MQAAREPGVWTRRRVATLVLGYLARPRRDDPRQGRLPLGRPLLPDPARAGPRACASGARTCATSCPSSRSCWCTRRRAASPTLLHPHPFYEPMLTLDRWIGFGQVPTVRLQGWLWHGHLEWYDHALSLLDRLHFIVPPTLLLLIWLERREVFYRCAVTLVAVSFAGAATFLIFPAAPPWLASKHGLDPPRLPDRLHRGRQTRPVATSKSWIEAHLLGNPVAAVPSLHAAYATLVRAVRLRLARPALGDLRGAVHARDVVHGRLPRRPLRRRHHRRRWPTRSPAGCWCRSSSGAGRSAGCSGRSRRP